MQKDMFSLFEQAEMRAAVAELPVIPRGEKAPLRKKVSVLLQHLKSGPLSTVDAEVVVHRGQAVICEMRAMGYTIETLAKRGCRFYILHGFCDDNIVKVSKTVQQKYYETSHWKRTALKRKVIDNFRCVQCGNTKDLNTHHWRYLLFNEDVEHDLVTLCRGCHSAVHDAISGSKVHFPRYVTVDLFERLKAEVNDNNNDSADGSQAAIGESVDTGGCASDSGQSSSHQDATGVGWGIAEDSKSGSGNQAQG